MTKWLVVIICLVGTMAYATKSSTADPFPYFAVLAGGSGERLWPLSRAKKPKQLLALNSEKTLLEQAIGRIEPLAGSKENVWVITSAQHRERIAACVGDTVGTILVEPAARNTGPAILYTCFHLAQKDPDAVVVFLPADPFIPIEDNQKFIDFLSRAISLAQTQDVIALLGVEPTYPATGYGYIEYDADKQDDATGLHAVTHFHEKPSAERAQDYISRGNMLWNIGMFCGKVQTFLEEFERYCPELFNDVKRAVEAPELYRQVQSISVDYAVIEQSDRVWVLPVDFTWFDVGNVGVFLALQEAQQGKVISVNSSNNLVSVPDRLVALVGVDDLCVVQTDDALLIIRRDDAEAVKQIVERLKVDKLTDYL